MDLVFGSDRSDSCFNLQQWRRITVVAGVALGAAVTPGLHGSSQAAELVKPKRPTATRKGRRSLGIAPMLC